MRFLRIRQVMQVTGLSRMTIYRLEIAGKFPRRRRLSGNSVAWLESDIETWARERPVAQLRESPQDSSHLTSTAQPTLSTSKLVESSAGPQPP
jgi:prophage regulatory protein